MFTKNNIKEKKYTRDDSFIENILSFVRIIKSLVITRIFFLNL